jgi:single-strand DNA-binding protein
MFGSLVLPQENSVMANLNKVFLIGNLTRDPEVRVFANGGKVAKFGFAVNNRRKNQQTGQWENEPVFLEVEAFNRGDFGKKADLVEQYLQKGRQIFIEGHLRFDQWTSQDGQKRSQLKIVLDDLQFLDSKQDGGSRPASPARRPMDQGPGPGPEESFEPPGPGMDTPPADKQEDIPF